MISNREMRNYLPRLFFSLNKAMKSIAIKIIGPNNSNPNAPKIANVDIIKYLTKAKMI